METQKVGELVIDLFDGKCEVSLDGCIYEIFSYFPVRGRVEVKLEYDLNSNQYKMYDISLDKETFTMVYTPTPIRKINKITRECLYER